MTAKTDSNQRVLYPVKDITEGSRIRKDYGDVDGLAESIKEHGLLHPIVINTKGVLIAGGRRFRAMRDILKWTEVPITYFEFADEATLRILEREENVRRKQMTWQEECLSILDVHRHHAMETALSGKGRWTQRATGELLGMSEANVSYAVTLGDLVARGDKEILACPRAWDALQLLVKRRADESTKLVAKLTIPNRSDIPSSAGAEGSIDDLFSPVPGQVVPSSGGVSASLADDGEVPTAPVPISSERFTIPLSKMLLRGSFVDIGENLPAESIDHVITDWPYGIDMDNLEQSGGGKDVASTAAEHNVLENEALHQVSIPLIYRLLRPNGFFITWTDISQWQRNYDLCIKAGFKVQRWPLVWYKTSRCQNMMASYNFTKNYEIAIVCRKGNATLLSPQASSVWVGGNEGEVQTLGHPFAKPIKLWDWLYQAVAQRGQTVLDPFAGRGSSTIAALQYGLSPLACELNEAHYSGLVVNVSEWYRKSLKNVDFS